MRAHTGFLMHSMIKSVLFRDINMPASKLVFNVSVAINTDDMVPSISAAATKRVQEIKVALPSVVEC
jgi:hypothetical protein